MSIPTREARNIFISCFFLFLTPHFSSIHKVFIIGKRTYKEYKGNDAIIKNCVLAGDMGLLENDASIYTGVLDILANLLSASKAELKKV